MTFPNIFVGIYNLGTDCRERHGTKLGSQITGGEADRDRGQVHAVVPQDGHPGHQLQLGLSLPVQAPVAADLVSRARPGGSHLLRPGLAT